MKWTAFLLNFCLALCFSWAAEGIPNTVPLKGDAGVTRLWEQAVYFVDPSGTLNLSQAKKLPEDSWTSRSPEFGYTQDAVWMRFRIVNHTASENFTLILNHIYINELDIVLESASKVSTLRSGLDRRLADPEVPHYGFAFATKLEKGVTTVYVRAVSKFPITLNFTVQESSAFLTELRSYDRIFWAYIGVIGILVFINLFVFILSQNRSYLYYVFTLLALHLYTNLTQFGLTRAFFFPQWTWFQSNSFYFDHPLSLVTLTLFFRHFVSLPERLPKLSTVLTAIVALCLALTFAGLTLQLPIIDAISQANTTVFTFLLLFIGYKGWRASHRPSKFFVVGWCFLLTSWIINFLRIDGQLEPTVRLDFLILLGAIIEGTILSLALADRLRTLSREKELAEKRAFEADTQAKIAAQVSHDIRSPLSALNMVLSTLAIPEGKQKILQVASQRINSIANDLLSKSRQCREEQANVRTVLENLLSEKRAQYSGVLISLDISAGYDLLAPINPVELSRCLSNLVDNAVEAGGDLKIELHATTSNIRILIADTGRGIPADILKQIGTKGFSHGKTGSGLGVFSAQQSIEEAGGDLRFSSTLGHGTSVTITLPVRSK